ncbi:MAG TPA: hypothetical protein ENI73_06520 [Spirochaetes bacterium]|nr:hypothetical protein [Spirochaetota bacterium]
MKKSKFYYLLVFILLMSGLTFSTILSYNYFNPNQSIGCTAGGALDCSKISGPDSKVLPRSLSHPLGIHLSFWGLGFYLIAVLYFLFPSMNPKGEDYLKIPFFSLLILVSLGVLSLVSVLIYTFIKEGGTCPICIFFHINTLALLIVFYFHEFKGKNLLGEYGQYFKSLKSDLLYQKELAIYAVLSMLMFSLLFFFSSHQSQKAFNGINVFQSGSKKEQALYSEAMDVYKKQPVVSIPTENFPTKGDPNSPFHLVIIHDIQCPHCQHSYPFIKDLVNQYPGLVKATYIDFPFLGSRSGVSQFNSIQLTGFAKVAHENKKYFKFTESLYELYKKRIYVDKEQLKRIFKSINIDMPFSEIERRAQGMQLSIEKQIRMTEKLFMMNKVNQPSTPAFFLNGQLLIMGFGEQVKGLLKTAVREIIFDCLRKNQNKS